MLLRFLATSNRLSVELESETSFSQTQAPNMTSFTIVNQNEIQLSKAIQNTRVDGKVLNKEEPRVWFFYWNEDKIPTRKEIEKAASLKKTTCSDDKECAKTVKKCSPYLEAVKKMATGRRTVSKSGRRRTLAYVWLDGVVYYAGSVYNPNDGTSFTIPPWNREGERVTALSRLSLRPVVLAIPKVSTHNEVRRIIIKGLFDKDLGAMGPRTPLPAVLKA